MPEELRRSSRVAKLNRNSDYIYEEDEQEDLAPSNTVDDAWQRCNPADFNPVKTATPKKLVNEASGLSVRPRANWDDLLKVTSFKSIHESAQFYLDYRAQELLGEGVLSSLNKPTSSACAPIQPAAKVNIERKKLNSTTADGYLDISGNFLSVDMSEQSDSDNVYVAEAASKCGGSKQSLDDPVSDPSVLDAVMKALSKLDLITEEVKCNKKLLNSLSHRVYNIESDRNSSDINNNAFLKETVNKTRRSELGAVSLDLPAPLSDRTVPSKSKKDRVEFERDRTLHLLYNKLEERDKQGASPSEDYTTEEDLLGLKKRMPRKLKEESRLKAAYRLSQAGATFPVEETSDCSGMESDVRSSDSVRRRRKVKSGAEVKTRPVIRTELWPHTIANEEEGEGVTSETITLATFLQYFTLIITTTKGIESSGRSLLLHAVTKVIKKTSWETARLFHNLVMLKLEQGRLGWNDNFIELADTYLNSKVQLLLKAKPQAASGNSKYSSGRHNSNRRDSPGFFQVCYKWNEGTCTYGDKCKRSHVCRTCAESGRPGERHKSSFHKDKGKPGE